MSVVVVGMSHRSAPIEILERTALSPTALPNALAGLYQSKNIGEVIVISTCNRIEVYAVCETFHGALGDINQFFCNISGLSLDQFAQYTNAHYDDACINHLFGVAAGLDSAVVGESEILGQIKRAFDAALLANTAGPRLSLLFRHALEVGKRARTQTSIAKGTASVSHACVELAADCFEGSLQGRSALVLGAGEIGLTMITALKAQGVNEIFVANRTPQRAGAVANQVGATAIELHEVPHVLSQVDLFLSATSSTQTLFDVESMVEVMASRNERSLVIVDAALPRDLDPEIGKLSGVSLFDLASIGEFVERGIDLRRGEIEQVIDIVAQEVQRYSQNSKARQLDPLVVSFREQLNEIGDHELARLAGKVSNEELERVTEFSKRLIAKLVHEPTVTLKSHAGTPKGERLCDALATLFGLE